MFDMIKKVFSVLSSLPTFTNLFRNASKTGKIDPMETLSALSSLSPSTKKCADIAMNTVQNGGGIPDVANALSNVGEVEILGQKVNTKTMVNDLKRAGGICGIMANMLDNMKNQSPQDIVNFGNQAMNVNNWQDIIKNN